MRADGVAKVTGSGRYTADISFPGICHAQFLLAGRHMLGSCASVAIGCFGIPV